MYTVEFQDFTELGGIGTYKIRVKADSAEDAEKIIQRINPSSWDVQSREDA
tara:strand:+ start:43 stop:195 length:153 start_codon:yes stop_codon:yes gene_type:complete